MGTGGRSTMRNTPTFIVIMKVFPNTIRVKRGYLMLCSSFRELLNDAFQYRGYVATDVGR
jgi:hypothetical protein